MEHGERTKEERKQANDGPALSDVEIERLKRQRFQERVERVLEVMTRERVDWRAIPYITPDGRIVARVVPAEMDRP